MIRYVISRREGGERIAIMSVIKHAKKTMVFQCFTKFVVDHDPGHCSLEVKGLNVHRVEASLWYFLTKI